MQNFRLFCTKKKKIFFYFTHPFLQNTHISPSILHNYSIKYSFFYNFLLFPHSLPLFLTDPTLPTITPHLATIITHPFNPARSTPLPESPFNPARLVPLLENPQIKQRETKETQIITHPTRNPLIKQQEIIYKLDLIM